MRRFGSRVTLIERNPRLIHREDQDISEAMHELFQEEGIEVITSACVTRVEGRSGQAVKLHVNWVRVFENKNVRLVAITHNN